MELTQLRSYCEQQDIPLISQATEDFLRKHIAQYTPHRIIEVGSAVGYSSSVIAEAMYQHSPGDPSLSLMSREISYPHYRQALQTLKQRHYHFVYYFLGHINRYPLERYIIQPYDMLFIDGRKSETLDYLRQLTHSIHPLTTIIIDDVIKFKEKMHETYDYLDTHHIAYTILPLDSDDGVMFIQGKDRLRGSDE